MTVSSESRIKVSVVVCTRNSHDRILDTLESLKHQSIADVDYEVIVVDNASDDGTGPWLQEQAARFGFRFVVESEIGLSAARNKGIEESTGEMIYFTDDDAVVPAHVLQVLWNDMAEQNADVVGGPVHGLWEDTPPDWFLSSQWRRVSLLSYGNRSAWLQYPDILIGCNMGFRRSTFEQHGMFDQQFGRKGQSLVGNEERLLEWRIMKRGGTVFYNPRAYVFHKVPQARMGVDYLRERTLAGALGNLALSEITGDDDPMLERYRSYDRSKSWPGRTKDRFERSFDGLRFRISVLRRAVRLLEGYYRLEVTLQQCSREARLMYLGNRSVSAKSTDSCD